MTFDSHGNPMNVHCPDPEKINNNQIFTRYKLVKKNGFSENVDKNAIKNLKQANARRVKIQPGADESFGGNSKANKMRNNTYN